MKLGESIQTYNPTMVLKRETGIFHVKTPGGEELTVTCEPGETLGNIAWTHPDKNNPFVVTKIGEPVATTGYQPLRVAG